MEPPRVTPLRNVCTSLGAHVFQATVLLVQYDDGILNSDVLLVVCIRNKQRPEKQQRILEPFTFAQHGTFATDHANALLDSLLAQAVVKA